MMKLSRLLILITGLVMAIGCGGVYAIWYYDMPFVEHSSADALLNLHEFLFAPSEILPGTEEDTKLETNHQAILEQILTSNKYGLNQSNTLHSNMARYEDLISCYENGISGGNMNNIPRAGNLGFTLTCTRENGEITSYFLYTFGEFDSYQIGDHIVVYKTLIVKDSGGEWTASLSWLGYVTASSSSIAQKKGNNYILPEYWVKGNPPT